MGKWLVLGWLAGCQPLYGGKPERLPSSHEPSRWHVDERAREDRLYQAVKDLRAVFVPYVRLRVSALASSRSE